MDSVCLVDEYPLSYFEIIPDAMVILRTSSPSDVVAVYQKGNLGGKLAFKIFTSKQKSLITLKCFANSEVHFSSYARVVYKKAVFKLLRRFNTGFGDPRQSLC